MKKAAATFFFLLTLASALQASKFDELDKPPEGAHKGQMFLGVFLSMGGAFGDIIDAENKFVKGSTYEFTDTNITKRLWIDHLVFVVGVSFEYMYLDFMGVKLKIKRTMMMQRTVFGPQYKNWTENLYTDFAFCAGPTFHAVTRKQWDFTFTPVIGYAVAEFSAAPIAKELINNIDGRRKQDAGNFTFGAEVNFSIYFSGGLYLSLGFDYTLNVIQFDSQFNLNNPMTGKMYSSIGDITYLHSLLFILSVGYAFSN